METVNYAAASETLAATMDKVVAEHAPILITRASLPPVVMLSLEDYESIQETAYLMSSPANAQRLLASIHALADGHGSRHDAAALLDP